MDFARPCLRPGKSPVAAARVPGLVFYFVFFCFWINKAFGWIHTTAEDHDCFGRWQSRAPNEAFSVRSR